MSSTISQPRSASKRSCCRWSGSRSRRSRRSSRAPRAGTRRCRTRGRRSVIPASGRIAVDDRPDQRPRREVLPRARLHVLRVLLEQPLVGVALDVGVEREPRLAVDQVDDQPPQLRRVLDLVLRLAEDDAEHPRLAPELARARAGSAPRARRRRARAGSASRARRARSRSPSNGGFVCSSAIFRKSR